MKNRLNAIFLFNWQILSIRVNKSKKKLSIWPNRSIWKITSALPHITVAFFIRTLHLPYHILPMHFLKRKLHRVYHKLPHILSFHSLLRIFHLPYHILPWHPLLRKFHLPYYILPWHPIVSKHILYQTLLFLCKNKEYHNKVNLYRSRVYIRLLQQSMLSTLVLIM